MRSFFSAIVRSPLFLLAGILTFVYGGLQFWGLVIVPHVSNVSRFKFPGNKGQNFLNIDNSNNN